VGVQVGVTGPRVAVAERGREDPGGVQLLHPVAATAGAHRVPLQPRQRVLDGGVVRGGDLVRDSLGGDRPQRRHRFDRGEAQVEPGDGGSRRPGMAGDERGQLAGVLRGTAVLPGEHVPADVGAHPGPLRGRQRPVVRHSQPGVDLRAGLGHGHPERRGGVDHRERRTEPDRVLHVLQAPGPAGPLVHDLFGDGVGVRVPALPEQGAHLRGGHLRPVLQVDVTQGGAEPLPWGLPALAVVVRQAGVAALRGVERSDLPGQVRVPVPGGQLVKGHHTPVSTKPPAGSTRSRQLSWSNVLFDLGWGGGRAPMMQEV